MAKSILDSAEIGVPCPGCGHETKKSVGWLRSHDELVCSGCGETIRLDDEGFRAGLDSADKAMGDFKRNLARLNKRR